jgi:hypothetical protein
MRYDSPLSRFFCLVKSESVSWADCLGEALLLLLISFPFLFWWLGQGLGGGRSLGGWLGGWVVFGREEGSGVISFLLFGFVLGFFFCPLLLGVHLLAR